MRVPLGRARICKCDANRNEDQPSPNLSQGERGRSNRMRDADKNE